jgi:CHAT domain-containing protein
VHRADDVQNRLLEEIAGLRPGGCLVVLSACDGAAADMLPGEELLSLSWSFLVGGASGVVASLWRNEDADARHFMALFYTELQIYKDPAVALARTHGN